MLYIICITIDCETKIFIWCRRPNSSVYQFCTSEYILVKKSSTIVEDLIVLNRNDLLSQAAARQVPSALKGLTAVFGMGTGVTPSL